jgi:importin subunit beta-1
VLLLKQDTIFQLTHNAVQKDEEDVAKQAIEFWCSICEEEAAIQEVGCSDPPIVEYPAGV